MAPPANGIRRELILLAATEAWERFSYYGIRGLLVLFLTASATSGGMQWHADSALRLLGWFAALVYVLPVAGGLCGDRLIGSQRAVRAGTAILVVAYGLLAASAWWQQTLHVSARCAAAAQAGLQSAASFGCSSSLPRNLMFSALVLIALGTGLFKPNITALVGRLYRKNDASREGGFLLFYLFMNIGVVLSGLVIGTLGEQVAWHFGFMAAAAAMLLSGFVFSHSSSSLRRQADLRVPATESGAAAASGEDQIAVARGWAGLSRGERAAIAVLAILGVFATLFWVGLEQTAGLLNLFAFENTQRQFGDVTIPATWFQSLNPLFVFVLAPTFAVLWRTLAARGSDLRTEWKFVLGLVAMASAFALMSLAARGSGGEALASPGWLISAYFLLTVSELCVWTISLAAVTRLSPRRHEGLIIGLWYMAVAVGSWCAGQIGALTASIPMGEVFGLLSRMFLFGALLLALATPLTARLARRAAAAEGTAAA
ncbi:MAG: peptide MFS transporter [Steroidobacteraceae bacterium]